MMLARISRLVAAVVVTCVALFVATEVGAQPDTCVAGPYTITFNGVTRPSPGTLNWQYTVAATVSNLERVKEAVMVVPLPVTPQDIQSQTSGNFCEQSDPNTKINRGNCAGFPVHIQPVPVSGPNRLVLNLLTDDKITPGVVTISILFGRDDSHVCIANTEEGPTGIKGPGAGPGGEVNPFAVIGTTTTFTAPDCTITVTKNSKDQIVSVAPASPCTLAVDGGPISDVVIDNLAINPQQVNFVSAGGGVITIIGSDSSPGCTWLFDGSGRYWLICF